MSITIRPTRWTVGLAIVLAVGLGALAYAASQLVYDRQTGSFSVDEEGALAHLETYDATTGAMDPAWASCAASGMVAGQTTHCLVLVTNQKTTGPIRYGIQVIPGASNDLASKLYVTLLAVPTETACNASASNVIVPTTPLSSSPAFGDPAPGAQAGDRELATSELVCIRVHYDPGTVPPPFGQSVDATVRVNTDDSGL